jgi:hypothetical protein
VLAVLQGRGQAAGITVLAQQAGTPELAASSLKAALDADWDDPAARDEALAEVPGMLDRVEAFIAGQAGEQAAAEAAAAARQVRDQDVDLTGPAPTLRRGVAKDRRISVEDSQMRHGRKSRSVLFDGYKRHVLRDLDTGLVVAAGITPANAPEASVTGDIAADLDAAGLALFEPIGEKFRKDMNAWAQANGVPVIRFRAGERKADVMAPYLEAAVASGRSQVAAIGCTQEFQLVWTARKRDTDPGACPSSPSPRSSGAYRSFTSTSLMSRWGRGSSRSAPTSRTRSRSG